MGQQGLAFQYELDNNSNTTALAGLPLFIDMAIVSGLCDTIARMLSIKERGWTDKQVILSLILLNLSGGDCVDDIDRLESDDGLRMLMLRLETQGMKRSERREYERRFRKNKKRAFPSATVIHSYLKNFHNADEESGRVEGKAFIPQPNKFLTALNTINGALIKFIQEKNPCEIATLDQDATLVETSKSTALYSYKKSKAYQPFNTYWNEQGVILGSEFRDGNVPAGYQQLRLFEDSLDQLPETVNKVFLRSDSAGYQEDLLSYCAEGKSKRFGVIEFAISARVTKGFKEAVAGLAEEAWSPIYKTLPNGDTLKTEQESAEVCFVPAWAALKKDTPVYRYIAIREKMSVQKTLPGIERVQQQLPFQTIAIKKHEYKLFSLVTNRDGDANELINWHRGRCGDSEKIHSVEKNDLAGGQFPSNKFGANAAWWAVMVLSLNLVTLMKKLVLPSSVSKKRLKGLRFHVINLAGRAVTHARGFCIKISGGEKTFKLIQTIRERIEQLALPPPLPLGD